MLTDKSIMTFGIHKGKTMQNVPAQYLLFLHSKMQNDIDNGLTLTRQAKEVYDYVVDNFDVLQKEFKQSK